jgi:hypothetical protein
MSTDNDAINPDYAKANPNWRNTERYPLSDEACAQWLRTMNPEEAPPSIAEVWQECARRAREWKERAHYEIGRSHVLEQDNNHLRDLLRDSKELLGDRHRCWGPHPCIVCAHLLKAHAALEGKE